MSSIQRQARPEPREAIIRLRGQAVILDSDLAALYGVTVKRLNQQVRRNRERFPDDFCFQLTLEEAQRSRSQFATASIAFATKHRPPSRSFKENTGRRN